MITPQAKLLADKKGLLRRLEQNPTPRERAEIERLLAQVNTTLELLDEPGPEDAR
jgi:hypothetical protein